MASSSTDPNTTGGEEKRGKHSPRLPTAKPASAKLAEKGKAPDKEAQQAEQEGQEDPKGWRCGPDVRPDTEHSEASTCKKFCGEQ